MKPIAQSFLVSQPDTSIEGIFLTKIEVYFQRVSSTYGITMEIRTVDNGFPTPNVIPGGRCFLNASAVTASTTASVSTSFVFDALPFLRTNTQYAFALIPDGGNDEYLIWTAKLGQRDTTGVDIMTNNQLGNMFISSNDLVFTPIIDENIKYKMYAANFQSSTATAYFRPISTEFMRINNVVGSFLNQENIWVSNSQYTYAQTTINSTTVTVPNSSISDLAVNNWIFLAKSDRSSIDFARVASTINSTAITISSNASFTNTTCTFGRIAGDSQLFATVKTQLQFSSQEEVELVLINPTSNSTINFSTSANQFIFGLGSKASANISAVANKQYDAVTPNMNFMAPAQTGISFSYAGYSNAGVKDASYIAAQVNNPNEFIDTERKFYSRSNALANNTIGSNSTLLIRADLRTSNNLTAPYIDLLGTAVVLTYNSPTSQTQLSGYHLNLANTTGKFLVGETITQGSNTGVVDGANNSYIRINIANGSFTNTSIVGASSGATANVTAATYFDETLENGYYGASRYISKNVILADQQDAEDLVSYLTIYRPVGTQFLVYGKFQNGSDTDAFSSKDWSYMPELDVTTALFSSPVNRDDLIEAQFGLPTSVMIDPDSAVTNTSLANVTVLNSTYYTANSYVYLRNNATGEFNVRRVSALANSSTLTLYSVPSFSSSNVTVGYIPNLQSESGAFLYANNNNIIRYVTSDDVVYDSYKTFAVKIVPISNNSILVPIMKNMRAIALQV